jgi:hypothetical protein
MREHRESEESRYVATADCEKCERGFSYASETHQRIGDFLNVDAGLFFLFKFRNAVLLAVIARASSRAPYCVTPQATPRTVSAILAGFSNHGRATADSTSTCLLTRTGGRKRNFFDFKEAVKY